MTTRSRSSRLRPATVGGLDCEVDDGLRGWTDEDEIPTKRYDHPRKEMDDVPYRKLTNWFFAKGDQVEASRRPLPKDYRADFTPGVYLFGELEPSSDCCASSAVAEASATIDATSSSKRDDGATDGTDGAAATISAGASDDLPPPPSNTNGNLRVVLKRPRDWIMDLWYDTRGIWIGTKTAWYQLKVPDATPVPIPVPAVAGRPRVGRTASARFATVASTTAKAVSQDAADARGEWAGTRSESYQSKVPDDTPVPVPVAVAGRPADGRPADEGSAAASSTTTTTTTTMSQAALHLRHRALFGLMSNIADMIGMWSEQPSASSSSSNSRGAKDVVDGGSGVDRGAFEFAPSEYVDVHIARHPETCHALLSPVPDVLRKHPELNVEPFDMDLLRREACFVRAALKRCGLDPTSTFMKGLASLEDEFVTAKKRGEPWAVEKGEENHGEGGVASSFDYETSAIRAERRSHQALYGDRAQGMGVPHPNKLIDIEVEASRAKLTYSAVPMASPADVAIESGDDSAGEDDYDDDDDDDDDDYYTGWRVQNVPRKNSDHVDKYYISPGGRRFRSRKEVERFQEALRAVGGTDEEAAWDRMNPRKKRKEVKKKPVVRQVKKSPKVKQEKKVPKVKEDEKVPAVSYLKKEQVAGQGNNDAGDAVPAPDFGEGWRVQKVPRRNKSAMAHDTYYFTPGGIRLRSRKEVERFQEALHAVGGTDEESAWDLMSPGKARKEVKKPADDSNIMVACDNDVFQGGYSVDTTKMKKNEGEKEQAEEDFDTLLWPRLVTLGWTSEQTQGKSERSKARGPTTYYFPPGVTRGNGRCRRDYFDSRLQVRRYAAAMEGGGEANSSDEGGGGSLVRWECHRCTFHNELTNMRCQQCDSWKRGTRDSTPQSTVGCKMIFAHEGPSEHSNREDGPEADVVSSDKAPSSFASALVSAAKTEEASTIETPCSIEAPSAVKEATATTTGTGSAARVEMDENNDNDMEIVPALDVGEGWRVVKAVPRHNKSMSTHDTYYLTPGGRKLRSRKEVKMFQEALHAVGGIDEEAAAWDLMRNPCNMGEHKKKSGMTADNAKGVLNENNNGAEVTAKTCHIQQKEKAGKEDFESALWPQLVQLGWIMEKRSGRKYYFPPGVTRKDGKLRKDYFDSKKQVINHVNALSRSQPSSFERLDRTGPPLLVQVPTTREQ